jgi:aspartate kinase
VTEASRILDAAVKEIGAEKLEVDENVAKVSVIGNGMISHAGVAAKIFQTLSDERINILMISTSEIKVSCVVEAKYTELAVTSLHDAFALGKNP